MLGVGPKEDATSRYRYRKILYTDAIPIQKCYDDYERENNLEKNANLRKIQDPKKTEFDESNSENARLFKMFFGVWDTL